MPLEQQRSHKWLRTVANVGHMPVGWFTKVKVLRATMSQLTYAQGTHVLPVARDHMRHLRATVVRALFHVRDYSLSPHAVFALLAPPSLEPNFALQLSAFQLTQRVHCTSASRRDLASRLAAAGRASLPDGPLARAQQLMYHPVFKASFQAFLRGQLHAESYQHELREQHRLEVWKTLARERPQHFRGASAGIDRAHALAWLNELTEQADSLQYLCDHSLVEPPAPEKDPRAKLKVLRLLLTAGLMTPERSHRHRRKGGAVQCSCGSGEPTIAHQLGLQ